MEPVTKSSQGPVRHHPVHNLLNLVLRILTVGATLAAVLVMVKSTETINTPTGPFTAKWRHVTAFKWFMVANSFVLVYSALAALVAALSVCTRRGPLSYRPLAWLTFLVDFVMQAVLMSGASAALAVAWIGRHGLPTAQWNKICPNVDYFCDYVTGAIISTVIAYVLQALSLILVVSALHNLASHRL